MTGNIPASQQHDSSLLFDFLSSHRLLTISHGFILYLSPIPILAPINDILRHIKNHRHHRRADILRHRLQDTETIIYIEVIGSVLQHTLSLHIPIHTHPRHLLQCHRLRIMGLRVQQARSIEGQRIYQPYSRFHRHLQLYHLDFQP